MALYAFDGTCNENEKLEEAINVVRFAEIIKKQSVEVVEYTEGVGMRFGVIGRLLGGLFGSGGRSRIHEMYDELKDNWQKGDHTIDIIGFSRGATLAVHCATVLRIMAWNWLLEKAMASGLAINPDDVSKIKVQSSPPPRIRNNLDPQRDAMREIKPGDKAAFSV